MKEKQQSRLFFKQRNKAEIQEKRMKANMIF